MASNLPTVPQNPPTSGPPPPDPNNISSLDILNFTDWRNNLAGMIESDKDAPDLSKNFNQTYSNNKHSQLNIGAVGTIVNYYGTPVAPGPQTTESPELSPTSGSTSAVPTPADLEQCSPESHSIAQNRPVTPTEPEFNPEGSSTARDDGTKPTRESQQSEYKHSQEKMTGNNLDTHDWDRIHHKKLVLPKGSPDHVVNYIKADSINTQDIGSKYAIRLWDPYANQNLSRAQQEKHCSVGDVGMFDRDGNFCVIFNIFMSRSDNQGMKYKLPPSFEPLDVDEEEYIERRRPRNIKDFISSNFVQLPSPRADSYGYQSVFQPRGGGGAIVVVPDGYLKTVLGFTKVHRVREYINRHVDRWYELGKEFSTEGPVLSNGELKLITARYQAVRWAAAVLPAKGYQPQLSTIHLNPDDKEKYGLSWTTYGPYVLNPGSAGSTSTVLDPGSAGSTSTAEKVLCTIAVEMVPLLRSAQDGRLSVLSQRFSTLSVRTALKLQTFAHSVTSTFKPSRSTPLGRM